MKKKAVVLLAVVVVVACGLAAVWAWRDGMQEVPAAATDAPAPVAARNGVNEGPQRAAATPENKPESASPREENAPVASGEVSTEPVARATPPEQPAPVRRQRPRAPSGELKMTRRAPAGGYAPGAPLHLEVGLEYDENAFPVTAMAVVEELPAGWTYEGIASGPKPTLEPPAGHPGPLQFIWVDIPKFPAMFSYRVRVPGDETGLRTITGQALYRTDGPQAETAAIETPLSPIAEVHR